MPRDRWQVAKVFSLVAARTGLRETEAHSADIPAHSITYTPDDHKAYYPGSHPVTIRLTGNPTTGQLLGAQIVGTYGTEIAKRSDILTTAIFTGLTIPQLSDLDLAYTPPLAAPWDAIQATAQQWQQCSGGDGSLHKWPCHPANPREGGVSH